jgi:hypothetical protein
MRADQTGIVVARGIGMGFVIIGTCSALGATVAFFEPAASSGWTSYSPLNTTSTTSFVYVSHAAMLQIWLPSLGELTLGSALVLFSKPVGRWLARGVRGESTGE